MAASQWTCPACAAGHASSRLSASWTLQPNSRRGTNGSCSAASKHKRGRNPLSEDRALVSPSLQPQVLGRHLPLHHPAGAAVVARAKAARALHSRLVQCAALGIEAAQAQLPLFGNMVNLTARSSWRQAWRRSGSSSTFANPQPVSLTAVRNWCQQARLEQLVAASERSDSTKLRHYVNGLCCVPLDAASLSKPVPARRACGSATSSRPWRNAAAAPFPLEPGGDGALAASPSGAARCALTAKATLNR